MMAKFHGKLCALRSCSYSAGSFSQATKTKNRKLSKTKSDRETVARQLIS